MLLAIALAIFSGRMEDTVVEGIVVIAIGIGALLALFVAGHMDRLAEHDPQLDGGRLVRLAIPAALRTLVFAIGVAALLIAILAGRTGMVRALLS